MSGSRIFPLLLMLLSFSGCATFRAATNVQSGRKALLTGQDESALGYFESAARTDPDYVYGTPLRQNVWTYLGRSEYATGRLPQARDTLKKALSMDNQNQELARLYLGLTLARSGDRQQGLKEIEGGMKGIYDWLEYVADAQRFSFGRFWDPQREIRSEIQNNLAMISSKEFDWQKLIANGEWLGNRVEEESDLARRDESRELSRESEGDGDSEP